MKIKIPKLESSNKDEVGVIAIAATSKAALDIDVYPLREKIFQIIEEVSNEVPSIYISRAISEQSMDSPYIYLIKIRAETGMRLVQALNTFQYKVEKKIKAIKKGLEITTEGIPI